jgi:hypothetical protein
MRQRLEKVIARGLRIVNGIQLKTPKEESTLQTHA